MGAGASGFVMNGRTSNASIHGQSKMGTSLLYQLTELIMMGIMSRAIADGLIKKRKQTIDAITY
jgi:hypothetical protein